MKIRINVDKLTALKNRKDRHGKFIIEVPVAEFSDQEIAILGRYDYSGSEPPQADFHLDRVRLNCYSNLGFKTDPYEDVHSIAAEPTAEAVHAVLAEIARADEQVEVARVTKEQQEAQKEEARIQELLIAPVDELVNNDYDPCKPTGQFQVYSEQDPRLAARQAEVLARVAELNALRDKARAERDATEKVEEERKAALKAQAALEKFAWIIDLGSDHLKRAHAAGYDCQRLYVQERTALEYPGFTIDFDDLAEWKGRACPSPEALDEAETVKGEVVWLTHPPYVLEAEADGYSCDDAYEAHEAVVVREFLGKYDLVKELEAS